MADTTKKVTNNAKSEARVTVTLPKLRGQNADQTEFFSINDRTCRVLRGQKVAIREEVAEVIRNNEQAEEYAMAYVDSLGKKEADKLKDLGIN